MPERSAVHPWQLVELGAVASSPWRNGGGVTRELACWPPGSEPWVWRMAVAEVAHDGPFSNFAGIERWFAVLAGGGVRLTIDGEANQLTRASAPLRFDGGAPTDCRLLAGTTQDFNLMLRGGQATARMVRIDGSREIVLDAPRTVAIYAIDAPASVELECSTLRVVANSLAWRTLAAGVTLRVSAAAALWIEIELLAADGASRSD